MTLSIKKTLMALAFSSLAISPVLAKSNKTDLKKVRNEVGIMLNILQASLKQQRSDKSIRFRAESVFYLAEQGVVFEIDSGRHGGNFFGFDLAGLMNVMPIAQLAPVAPKPPQSRSQRSSSSTDGNRFELSVGDREIDMINFDAAEIEVMVQRFMKHGDDYEDDMRDNMRELSEKKRELAWEKREYERSKRDLEFEKRNADGDRRKKVDKRLAELNKEVQKLDVKSKELDSYHKELDAEYKQDMAVRDAAKKKLYKEALAIFEDTVGDMLCSYGAGLKSLPEDENITFLLSDFVKANDDSVIDSHDKVYVFKQKDVKSCVTGRINKEKLLTSANTYLF